MINILFIASGLFLAVVLLISANNPKTLFLFILKIVTAYVIIILMTYCVKLMELN